MAKLSETTRRKLLSEMFARGGIAKRARNGWLIALALAAMAAAALIHTIS